MSTPQQAPLAQVGKLISLIPVGLKEAALDSPTFRATVIHYSEQIEAIEKWLDGYAKSVSKLTSEVSALEGIVNGFISQAVTPANVSEAILDPDYTVLAMKRYGEGTKDFWSSTLATLKRLEPLVADPIKSFLQVDIKTFKDIRRTLDYLQKSYDTIQARYASQAKTKEPSSLREDAFQLHEARKSYLKVSMDFCVLAPQLRNSLDKLLVRIFYDQWREMKTSRETTATTFGKWSQEMDRIRGWTREMEGSEKTFRRELHAARREIEDTAEAAVRPSRELEDYNVSTVPYLGSGSMSALNPKSSGKAGPVKFEKQGWLNLRTYTGKPTRTLWVRRWGFVKNGIFGWLIQGTRSGGVEESERIGVLLCNVRPAFQEERRFCFEVKTKNNAMMLQAETQAELTEWIGVFEAAKQKALESPSGADLGGGSGKPATADPAFSISPPPAPEFAAALSDSLSPQAAEEGTGSSFDRTSTLPIPGAGDAGLVRSSTDVSIPRRPTTLEKEIESSRDHASRIIQKLDLHRKSTAGPALANSGAATPSPATPGGSGGIASLISASHNLHSMLPVGTTMADAEPGKMKSMLGIGNRDMPPSTLAPSTLANPPAPTSLSKAAVSVSGERGIGVGRIDTTGSMPSGIMANLWGSSNWGYLNRLERGELKSASESRSSESPLPSPRIVPSGSPPKNSGLGLSLEENHKPESRLALGGELSNARSQSPAPSLHRQTASLDGEAAKVQRATSFTDEFPNNYPIQLMTQDAQFRLLFPNVRRSEKVVLVFRATWDPNEQQEFPGRAYVTTENIYFYSNHLGLVLTSGLSLGSVAEVTAAPGKDCDYMFLHMENATGEEEATRVTIKVFLEPLRLLQRRVGYLIRNASADEPDDLETVVKTLIQMEREEPGRSPSLESWEDVSLNTPVDQGASIGRTHSRKLSKDLKAPIRVDKALSETQKSKEVAKFKLPSRPIEYVPRGNLHLAVEKEFSISPKALFHVLFGDRSAVWQLLHHERQAQDIKQGPWINSSGHMRREFEYQVESTDVLGRTKLVNVSDYQMVDVLNDHLCYVVTDKRTPWHLPYRRNFVLVSKIVITHVAKSKSRLAVFTVVEWLRLPPILKNIVEAQAMDDLDQDALDLRDLAADQVRKLGAHSRTKKAINIFGLVGQETKVSHFAGGDSPLNAQDRRRLKPRTFTHLLYETVASFVQSALSSIMLWIFGLMRWIWKTCSANSTILFILLLSALVNGFFWSRESYSWWHERNASNFLSRVGVKPNMVMSKAIYVKDLDEVVSNFTGNLPDHTNTCYATFRKANHLQDLDAPSIPSSLIRSPSVDRLQRTRQRLGSRRHDLIVALRVINRIESEVIFAEWEKWIWEESRKCTKVGLLLEERRERVNETTDDDDDPDTGGRNLLHQQIRNVITTKVAPDRDGPSRPLGGDEMMGNEIYEWYEDYCGSCLHEQELLGTQISGSHW